MTTAADRQWIERTLAHEDGLPTPYNFLFCPTAAVRELKSTLGIGGGYILEPGITVQDDVPLANMLAMIDEARAG